MGRISFNNFGYVAGKSRDYTISASRFYHQKKYEKKIIIDIIKKLSLNESDDLLDIGCNVGTQLIPLSFVVDRVYGLDHKKCISKIQNRFPEIPKANLFNGNFLDIKIKKKFKKILCYSVLHYLQDENEFIYFVEKITKILKKGGIALVGDVPNKDLEKRFHNSKRGKIWLSNFYKSRSTARQRHKIENISTFLNKRKKDDKYVKIDNVLIKKLLTKIRKKTKKINRIRHNLDFTFGPTREDIIIYK